MCDASRASSDDAALIDPHSVGTRDAPGANSPCPTRRRFHHSSGGGGGGEDASQRGGGLRMPHSGGGEDTSQRGGG